MTASKSTIAADWPSTPQEAREIQEALRHRVVTEDRFGSVRIVVGLDAHYTPQQGLVWGAAAAMSYPELLLLESALACTPLTFPYVPGYLSFREAPALLAALQSLSLCPDLLLVDGQGLAHPRRFGLACHIGVLVDLPTIGVAKSRLVGSYKGPDPARGNSTFLLLHGEVVGTVVRTRNNTRPLFVSLGHRISLASAVQWVLRCVDRYRLPEPIRAADRLSRMHPVG
ncbi:MAG: deoxyribonuclease V [Kiloniellales bacterium]|nr:deoxyribonuclease V [Kiloniellales bacterium]